MVFTCPLISDSASLYINRLVTVPRATKLEVISSSPSGSSSFSSLARSRWFSFLFFFFFFFLLFYSFTLWSAKMTKSILRQVLFLFLLTISWSGRQAKVRWFVCISKSQRIVRLIFSDTFWIMHIPFVRMVRF